MAGDPIGSNSQESEQQRRERQTAQSVQTARGLLTILTAKAPHLALIMHVQHQETIIGDLVAKLGGEVTLDPFEHLSKGKQLRLSMTKDGKPTLRLVETVATKPSGGSHTVMDL